MAANTCWNSHVDLVVLPETRRPSTGVEATMTAEPIRAKCIYYVRSFSHSTAKVGSPNVQTIDLLQGPILTNLNCHGYEQPSSSPYSRASPCKVLDPLLMSPFGRQLSSAFDHRQILEGLTDAYVNQNTC